MKYLTLLFCFLTTIASAQVTSTRTTSYDWQCQDATGVRISDHNRFDTAFVACLNAPNGSLVKGGTYRIGKGVIAPPVTGSATINWTPPTLNADGSALTNLALHRIYYGTDPTSLTSMITVPAGTNTYTVTNLPLGTYYFSMTAVNAANVESMRTNVASKVVS